jgi:hypothetical protein
MLCNLTFGLRIVARLQGMKILKSFRAVPLSAKRSRGVKIDSF